MTAFAPAVLVAVKQTVIEHLQDRQAGEPALMTLAPATGERVPVRIDYAYNPRLAETEYVWGGAAREVRVRAGAGIIEAAVSLELFFDVRAFAAELAEADARAAEMFAAAERILMADPHLSGRLPGLVVREITAAEIQYGYYDDAAAMSSLGMDVLLRVDLRAGR